MYIDLSNNFIEHTILKFMQRSQPKQNKTDKKKKKKTQLWGEKKTELEALHVLILKCNTVFYKSKQYGVVTETGERNTGKDWRVQNYVFNIC